MTLPTQLRLGLGAREPDATCIVIVDAATGRYLGALAPAEGAGLELAREIVYRFNVHRGLAEASGKAVIELLDAMEELRRSALPAPASEGAPGGSRDRERYAVTAERCGVLTDPSRGSSDRSSPESWGCTDLGTGREARA